MTKEEAQTLQSLVNDILEKAFIERHTNKLVHDAINWGDLGCTDVEDRRSLLRESNLITVVIEEASPDATHLHKYVSEALEAKGYTDVFVCTEW